jgi:2-desacetyl-2-hydroxyethyl bacteriochlorophyllide A dehydrogenase
MKSYRLNVPAVRQIELQEFDPGPVPANGILVRNEYTTVSIGTELYAWVHGADPGMAPKFPRQTGYCSAGVVIEVGADVKDVKPGDRICGESRHVLHGIMTDPNTYQKIPDNVSSKAASLMTMAAVAMRGIRVAKIELGEAVIVQGLGLIGQMAVPLAKLAGARPLIGLDVDEFRIQKAKARGLDHAINPTQEKDLPAAIRAHCQEDGANVMIESTGIPATYPAALKLMAYNGRIIALGNPRGTVEMELDYDIMRREIKILGAPQPKTPNEYHIYYPWTRKRERKLIMDLMRDGDLTTEDLITAVETPEKCQQVYSMLADRPRETLGVTFDWSALAE